MSDTFDQTVELPAADVAANGHGPTGSVWDALRAKREEVAADRHLNLDVPGSDGLLVLQLGPVGGERQSKLMRRMNESKSPLKDTNLMADFLIEACQGILGRDSYEQPLEPMVDEDGEPDLVNEALGRRWGLPEGTSARNVLRYMFGFAPDADLAIVTAGGQYLNWASGTNVEVDEELLGEA